MGVTESFTDETGVSDPFNFSATQAIIIVTGDYSGDVAVDVSAPSADAWVPVLITTGRLAHAIAVPDISADYRIRASVAGTVNIYAGPTGS